MPTAAGDAKSPRRGNNLFEVIVPMPIKYHVHVQPVAPRFAPIPRYVGIETTRCLGCRTCVKNTTCVYNVYQKKQFDTVSSIDTGDIMCVMCLRCVQECKNNILSRAVNPRFDLLGDDYWTADIITKIWKQAETGKIPVSGAGYRGPFTGPGFDQMWTDMSEIVRPTRDGIHGREYISTLIELGRRPQRLQLDAEGRLREDFPPFVEVPLPVIIDRPDFGLLGPSTRAAMARAAQVLGGLAVAEVSELDAGLAEYRANLILRFNPELDTMDALVGVRMVELAWTEDAPAIAARVKQAYPAMVVSVRVPLDEHAPERALHLAEGGLDVIHLQAGPRGRGFGQNENVFITGLIRQVHLKLVEHALRERLAIIAGGGIALAEHVAKTIVCGADGVSADLAILAALECRLCRDCGPDRICPVELDTVPVGPGAQRIVNLMGAWHSQLLEVLGAMGLREVRRLRGEVGRVMFFDDLERDNFAPLFGQRSPTAVLSSGNPGVDAAQHEPDYERPVPRPEPYDWSFSGVPAEAQACASRYRNQLGKFLVVRTEACRASGRCAQACPYGVHVDVGGAMLRPRSYLCIGEQACREKHGRTCADECPNHALLLGPDPSWQTFGDYRWTADLLTSTWIQAETGRPPHNGLEYRRGASGGGFDRIDLVLPPEPPDASFKPADVDLRIPLNRTGDGRPEITIGFPIYGGGMSFGSISLSTMLGRARAYTAFDSFTCTGEGGFPGELTEYDDHVITQVATGLFGVREETIQRVRIVEFKYAQGAKPGLGGHLLGDKVTPAVAKMREAVVGTSLFSPFPFHSVYSVEDHKKHIDWIKAINSKALVSVKVSTPTDVDMVAVGSSFAGAHIIHIDGSYGGTGAAPDIAKKNIAMPIEYAIPKVHGFLKAEGLRDKVTLIASGGVRTAWDIAKAIALGADGVVIGTAEMVALECIRCANCESGRGCPRGIATTDPELSQTYSTEWASQRLINLFHSFAIQLQDILWRLGMKSVRELVGRSDVLTHRDYERPAR
jgi:glutamate synthase domain-containing protein 2/Na+-translocating ferredoxin:NAD+ oxidoreductase RNF subunit RnfB